MNRKFSFTLVIIMGIILSSCGQGMVIVATLTPLPIPISSSTLTQTLSPTPSETPTQTPIPVSLVYTPVPRWMILEQPFYSVEILGEIWNYTNDRWGESYACISYSRVQGTPIDFEQCFTLIYSDEVSFESQHDKFLEAGYEELTPQNTFSGAGQIALLGMRLENNVIEYFEIIGIGDFVTLIELDIQIEDSSSLQTIYEKQVADIMDYVLQDSLQKSHLIPRPTATPLSSKQEGYYVALGNKLITELEANTLYEGSWEALSDFVNPKAPHVCRNFEDRTNADVFWVRFGNCIYLYDESLASEFENYIENLDKTTNVFLESHHQYDDKFFLFGEQPGHTSFYAYLIHGEFLYFVWLESRTLAGMEIDDVFTESVDDFIYEVLMINTQR